MLLNRSLWKNVMDAERIICEECSKLYETPEEVELMGFMAEGNMKSLLKEGNIIEEEIKEYKYLECSMIPIELLLDTDKTKGRDVVKELIKQIMMGKDKGEIDHKYINEVSNAVRRRRKVEEERRLKIERELLGESKYSGARKKKKSRGGQEEETGSRGEEGRKGGRGGRAGGGSWRSFYFLGPWKE
ncbi:LidA-like protein [Encephalitozoon intestinalis]